MEKYTELIRDRAAKAVVMFSPDADPLIMAVGDTIKLNKAAQSPQNLSRLARSYLIAHEELCKGLLYPAAPLFLSL
ncbi:hypothetical protein MH117_08990 [Paenibacillus sp. ACRRX]|uniref:hypothetical protein n=1 Tax=unclassified Paenibacillus TaxID=185978 RepID=UPI001EF6A003|nr:MULTISPECIES: hypothetical protein [unclassified Paenibacillus]MCG7407557.1 hypothetical protein [Paenibacillus sp. ACRRX]MDK8180792.1 hypothetical protein [Paenibacillus sp. UMB4589-SE434]